MLRSSLFLGLSATGFFVGAFACSSSDSSVGSDSGGDGTVDAINSSSSSSSGGTVGDSGSTPKCDAAVVVPMSGTDGAPSSACLQCMTSTCGSTISACSGDCQCSASLTCLLMNNLNYTLCQNTALAAIMSGNPPLTSWNGCTATSCNCPCFHQCADGGASSD